MTRKDPQTCHCEERSDEAIQHADRPIGPGVVEELDRHGALCAPRDDKRRGETRFSLRPWVLMLVVFAGLFAAYFAAFRAAHQAQIREVPLATPGGRP